MVKYQNIWKYTCGYFQKHFKGSFVVRMSTGIGLVLFLLVGMLSLSTQRVQAHVLNACSAEDRSYSVITGDTLGEIASRYGTSWSSLASYNDIVNPDLIYVNQVVCIPTAGSAANASASAQPQIASAPVTSSVPGAVSSVPASDGSVTGIISQVFGPYASSAIQVANCESGLNPGATNPYSSAAGLFQIMPGTWNGTSQAGSSPYNAWANAVAAHEIFVRDGYSWSEWTCKA